MRASGYSTSEPLAPRVWARASSSTYLAAAGTTAAVASAPPTKKRTRSAFAGSAGARVRPLNSSNPKTRAPASAPPRCSSSKYLRKCSTRSMAAPRLFSS